MNEYAKDLLICLFGAYFLAEFLLPTSQSADRRERAWSVRLAHALSVALLSYLICGVWAAWQIVLFVLPVHYAIDEANTRFGFGGLKSLLIHQSMQLTARVIFCLPQVLPHILSGTIDDLTWVRILGSAFLEAIVIISGAVLTIQAGGVLTKRVVELLSTRTARPLLSGPPLNAEALSDDTDQEGLKGAGQLIGQLERTLIFLLVLSGNASGLGFLIAAKSLLRFGELKDSRHRKATEYIITGTLASFAFGLAGALLTKWALSIVSG